MFESAGAFVPQSMAWLPAVVSGLVASIVTVSVNNWLQNRREEHAWRRSQQRWLLDRRLQHYVDILEYVTSLRRVLRKSGLERNESANDVFAGSRDLNLRIRLMSSSRVRVRWKPILDLIENWHWGNIGDSSEARKKLWGLSDDLIDQLRLELTELDHPA
ncbi:hypothetical protein RMN56_30815 [Micromonospora halotolerans]|uniref:Minor tail protein n=1 Tax=Micromonospora halotolerans TaxID=709879 RepID=A0ABY9ZVX7_9ACTN|nr:hypothetical protein [Micromonospora halotolerans]WNM39451.1 hypothetical protein RMN56_30815 [Micromonospora halotolerans]